MTSLSQTTAMWRQKTRNSKRKDACPVLKLRYVYRTWMYQHPGITQPPPRLVDTGRTEAASLASSLGHASPAGSRDPGFGGSIHLVKPLICCVTSRHVTQTHYILSVKKNYRDEENHIILSCKTTLSWAQPTHGAGVIHCSQKSPMAFVNIFKVLNVLERKALEKTKLKSAVSALGGFFLQILPQSPAQNPPVAAGRYPSVSLPARQ